MSHQYKISKSSTRRRAERKWRHIANAQIRARASATQRRQRLPRMPKAQNLGQGVQWLDSDPLENKLPLP